MDNEGTRLIILLLRDPHLPEGGQGGQDGATNPDTALALRRSNDLDLHGGWGQGSDLLLHPVGNAGEHGATSRQDSVGIQVLPDVHVALHDGVVSGLMDTCGLHAQERGLEQGLWTSESLITDGDHLTVWKLVALFQAGALVSGLHLLLKVQGDVAQLLLDVTDDFTLGGGGEGVATLSQDLHQVVSQVTTGEVQTKDGVGKGTTLVDGDSVGDTLTRVEHNTSGTARGVQGQHGLDGDIHGWGVEGLEHDLGHLFTVGLWVKRSLSQEDWMLLWGHPKLIVEGVVPDLLQ